MLILFFGCVVGNVVLDDVANIAIKDTASFYLDSENTTAEISDEIIEPSEPSNEPSQPTSEPSQSTQPSNEPSQPTSEPSQSTQPSNEPSQPTSEPSQNVDPCSNSSLQTHTMNLSATVGCNWGHNGNLNDSQGVYTARDENIFILPLSNGQVICDVQFPFDTDHQSTGFIGPFGFDDQLLVTINDRVIAASHNELINVLQQDSYGYIYDWNSIKGTSMSFSTSNWFVDSSSYFSFLQAMDYPYVTPTTLALSHNSLQGVLQKIYDDNEIRFSLITFGDNDNHDCYHSDFYMDFQVAIGQ